MNKYLIVIIDKTHVQLIERYLKDVTLYPYDAHRLYFLFKRNQRDELVPICKVEKQIIDMTFTTAFNFFNYING